MSPDIAESCTPPTTSPTALHTTNRCSATTARGRACTLVAKPCGLCSVHVRLTTKDVPECPVCLEPLGRRVQAHMLCGHSFHAKCARAWFRNRPLSCPMCRTRCIEGIALLGPRLLPKLHALMRTVPPPPRAFFPSYIIGQLETPHVVAALTDDKHTVELLIDLACECFTRDVFFTKLRAMGL